MCLTFWGLGVFLFFFLYIFFEISTRRDKKRLFLSYLRQLNSFTLVN